MQTALLRMSDRGDHLRQLAACLIDPHCRWEQWAPALDQWYDDLCALAQIDPRNQALLDNVELKYGQAIGAYWAASCVKDYHRTRRFVQGIYQAIIDQQALHPGRAVNLLYAGTGPFATLVLPLMTLFRPGEVDFYFLEINPQSRAILGQVLELYNLSEYVRLISDADASTFQLPDDITIDIAVAETMQHALQREPQVAITLNLCRQLPPHAIFIPQQITISAGLLHPGKDTERAMGLLEDLQDAYLLLTVIFDLQKENAAQYLTAAGEYHFPVVETVAQIDEGYSRLCLFTKIRIYNDIQLDYSDSGLTLPKTLGDIAVPAVSLQFQYQLGVDPGFVWKMIPAR